MDLKESSLYLLPNRYFQSPLYAKYMQRCGWEVKEFWKKGQCFFLYFKVIPFFGLFAKIPKVPPEIWLLEEIFAWIQSNEPCLVKIEPLYGRFVSNASFPSIIHPLRNLNPWSLRCKEIGFAPIGASMYETKTRILDLSGSEDEIFKRIKRRSLRYQIKRARREGLKVEVSEDIETFVNTFEKASKRKGFFVPFRKNMRYFWEIFSQKNQAKIIFIRSNSSVLPLAGVFLVIHGKTAYYHHAASTLEGEKKFAPKLAVWEAMLEAHRLGCLLFDFEGIWDPKRKEQKQWKGLTYFKEGFGGWAFQYEKILSFYGGGFGKLLKVFQM